LSAVLFAVIAVLKGLRLPSLWAATQVSLDYRAGFIKRGFLGQILSGLRIHAAHYDVFVTVSAALFVGFIAFLASWVRTNEARRIAGGSVVAVFAASFTLTYMAHLIGYLDIPSAALAIAVILMSASRIYLPAAMVAGVLGVLIHENYVLTFLPATLLPAFLLRAAPGRSTFRSFLPIGAVVAVIGIIVLLVALGAPMTAQQVGKLQATMAATADFQPRADFFAVLTRSARANVLIMMSTMTHGSWWLAQANAFAAFMPTAAFFLWITLRIINTCHASLDRRLVKAAAIVASLCPLSLQIVGWDIYRWYALATFDCFLVMTIVCRLYGAQALVPLENETAIRNVAILLIGVNLATGTGLFDGYRVDTYPFVDHWRSLSRWLLTGGHWIQPAN
jgi:hypothetical protein